MKPETEQIVATIEVLTEGLYCSSVGNEPYGIIVWETEEKGEFSFLNFLIDVKALTFLEADEFTDRFHRTQSEKTIQQYQELIDLLQSNLSKLQLYSYDAPYLSKKHTNFYECHNEIEFPLIIGATPDGEWLAMTPGLYCKTKSIPPPFAIPSQEPTEITSNLIDRIKIITSNLAHKTRRGTLEPEEIMWKVVVTKNASDALEKVLNIADYVEVDRLHIFLGKDLKLKHFFQQKLIDARVYNLYFNEADYVVRYVLGKNKNGDYFGVFTDTYSW